MRPWTRVSGFNKAGIMKKRQNRRQEKPVGGWRNSQLKTGYILLALLLTAAFCAPWLADKNPETLYDDTLAPPGPEYVLGTDGLGRDVYAMTLYGTRTSLKIGAAVAALSALIGVTAGAVSGYFGGVADRLLSELLNVMMMTPAFFLMLIVVAVYGSDINRMILIMALTSWTGSARLMRGQAMALREKGFVQGARSIGESHLRILLRHIIPNGIFPVASNIAMTVSSAILTEASLSFLGLGDPNIVSWGKIIEQGRRYLPACWWISVPPGAAVALTAFAFYMLGDGVNRAIEGRE